jgi:hypothetical protein
MKTPLRLAAPLVLLLSAWILPAVSAAPAIDLVTGVTLHNAQSSPVTFQGKKALRLESPATTVRNDQDRLDHLALVPALGFQNGTIEVDLAGEPNPNASGGARGFVGVAFRVQPDRSTYDCVYLRPTNGRAEDQERRNHSLQYISHPDYPWSKLRQDFPSRYETYVDITPATWIHLRIEIDGVKARVFVDHREQPALIINDLKSGADASGQVALWFEGSTIAHFANLKITLR